MPNPLQRSDLIAPGHRPPVESAHDLGERGPSGQRQWLTSPLGAPNVLLVLINGMSRGAAASGGPRPMSTVGQLADDGRSTRVHTAALGSPVGTAVAHGHRHRTTLGVDEVVELSSTPPEREHMGSGWAAMLARTLSREGYATGAFSAWHQKRREGNAERAFHELPDLTGFDTFWALGGDADELVTGNPFLNASRMQEEARAVAATVVDRAVSWVDEVRAASPEKPWFGCLSFAATQRHLPRTRTRTRHPRNRSESVHGFTDAHAEAQVGRFLEHLERTGELDSTIVLQ